MSRLLTGLGAVLLGIILAAYLFLPSHPSAKLGDFKTGSPAVKVAILREQAGTLDTDTLIAVISAVGWMDTSMTMIDRGAPRSVGAAPPASPGGSRTASPRPGQDDGLAPVDTHTGMPAERTARISRSRSSSAVDPPASSAWSIRARLSRTASGADSRPAPPARARARAWGWAMRSSKDTGSVTISTAR